MRSRRASRAARATRIATSCRLRLTCGKTAETVDSDDLGETHRGGQGDGAATRAERTCTRLQYVAIRVDRRGRPRAPRILGERPPPAGGMKRRGAGQTAPRVASLSSSDEPRDPPARDDRRIRRALFAERPRARDDVAPRARCVSRGHGTRLGRGDPSTRGASKSATGPPHAAAPHALTSSRVRPARRRVVDGCEPGPHRCRLKACRERRLDSAGTASSR